MFSKILIANRGEIAVRVIRACKEMGITTVGVFSTADKNALHVSLSDESYCIGPAALKNSYLNMHAIISVAIASKAEAIHPGYGLLSENTEFADLCEKHNIVFIGPKSSVIAKMGDKDMARKTMKEAGVPVIPGTDIIPTVQEGLAAAKEIGCPLLIKARSGGGGRGIRLVNSLDEFENAFNTAVAEAENAFKDGAVYLEKYLTKVKHIEMQILVDNFSNVVCLGERDCSAQRKNQKMLEESPSTVVDNTLREKMMDVSAKAAIAAQYTGAGTIEFLLDKDKNFYFMEMNTRLQVEHPVTEMVTWVDLVKSQIRIAAGMKLGFSQKDIEIKGHAIECRINAENPYENFKPSCGTVSLLHIPSGPWVRFDTALYQNYSIPPFYDSMIGKLIVLAKTREEAIRKMKAALCELIIDGIEHNSDLQIELLSDEDFINGSYTTDFISKILP